MATIPTFGEWLSKVARTRAQSAATPADHPGQRHGAAPGPWTGRAYHRKGFEQMGFTIPPDGGFAPVYRLDDFRTVLPPEEPIDGDEVWAEVTAAAHLFGQLREAGMSVRFDVDDPTLPPRVRVT